MSCIRPATPGFLVTLVATCLLAVVSFCVPYIKSVYFLKASVTIQNQTGSITFGTLGYCYDFPGNSSCSSPSVGYELDINGLVGNRLPVEIPNVVVKWLTYALVLHIVALGLSAGSAAFGLLAHVREMSMTCCSTCVSGFAAVVAMVAFIFDIALFFIAKSRINSVPGGSAQIGSAIWLTLAAWLLLFFSGCFYSLGRCCSSQRNRSKSNWNKDGESGGFGGGFGNNNNDRYAEQMRLDAVKAEADRKARQKTQTEGGLPAFFETQPLAAQETQPLTGRIEGDSVYADTPYNDNATPSVYTGRQPSSGGGYAAGGYARAPAGSRAVDEYYNPTYPPQPQPQPQPPRRQPSGYAASSYAPSTYSYNAPRTSSPPPMPTVTPPPQRPVHTSPPPMPTHNQYLSAGNQYGYGHPPRETSYQSAVSHQPYASNYAQNADPTFNPDTYNSTALMTSPPVAENPYIGSTSNNNATAYDPTSYYNPHSPNAPVHQPQPDRSYTLGGDGYGQNTVPPLNASSYGANYDYAYSSPPHVSPAHTPSPAQAPAPVNTAVAAALAAAAQSPTTASPIKGPRPQPQPTYDDAPPVYEAGPSAPTGQWGKH